MYPEHWLQQRQGTPHVGELLNVVLGLERLHHYMFGSKIKVQTNCKAWIPIWKKEIAVANSWIQCLLLRPAKYNIKLTYLKGKDNVIADAFSQFSPLEPEDEDRDNCNAIPVHHIRNPCYTTLMWNCKFGNKDWPRTNLTQTLGFQGWPDARRSITESIYPFWNYWDEMSIEDGLIFKTPKLVIPTSQQ